MQEQVKERWQELCVKASLEHDSDKLMELVDEINRLLSERERLIKHPEFCVAKADPAAA